MVSIAPRPAHYFLFGRDADVHIPAPQVPGLKSGTLLLMRARFHNRGPGTFLFQLRKLIKVEYPVGQLKFWVGSQPHGLESHRSPPEFTETPRQIQERRLEHPVTMSSNRCDIQGINVDHRSDDMEIVEDEPGATIMWFGKHKSTRLDKLDGGYRRYLLRAYREKPWAPNVRHAPD